MKQGRNEALVSTLYCYIMTWAKCWVRVPSHPPARHPTLSGRNMPRPFSGFPKALEKTQHVADIYK